MISVEAVGTLTGRNASLYSGYAMFSEIEKIVPQGWVWSLYSGEKPRAVLVSPDYRVHIGRDGKTLQAALIAASDAARRGEKS